MKKIGLCFGGYCPLHQGHLDVIMRGKKENDICYVIVCGYTDEPRGNELGLRLEDREKLISAFFKGSPEIKVISINDTALGIDESMSLENWKIWQEEVKRLVWRDEEEYTWYLSEPEYKESIEKVNILGAKVVLMQKELQVSGSQIRENPRKYWNMITAPFRPFLCKNILITGTASEGKSTLVKDIALYFDIPYSSEFGKDWMMERGLKDTDLGIKEFSLFLQEQNNSIHEGIQKAKDGIFIADTDNVVTLMYAKSYASDPGISLTQEDYENLYRQALGMNTIKWDHIFVFPPHQEFVDDGTRYMAQSGMEERKKNYDILYSLMTEFYPEVPKTYLSGTFYDNFRAIKRYVQSFYI